MHRSAAPDKTKHLSNARRDGANVTRQDQDDNARHPERQGQGNDERGNYGSAAQSSTSAAVKPGRK